VNVDRDLICIVDDDDSVRRALGRMVSSFGFDVQLFSSARDCLDGPYVGQASCLVADVRMPEIDGFELHALLEASGRNIPTIFISAYCDQKSVERAKSVGGVALLNKPCVTNSLHDAILDAISKQH
jgi:FixJ family two-component response regulator